MSRIIEIVRWGLLFTLLTPAVVGADGPIVAWGANGQGQCNVPAPNEDFVAVAAGDLHSLGLKVDGSIVAWGWNFYTQCDVPAPNADFVSIAAGAYHSLGLKATVPPVPGDLDGDGDVDFDDLNILLASYNADAGGDVDGDGDTDFDDLNILLGNYGG